MLNQKDRDAMSLAIQNLRAGECEICGQIRKALKIEASVGFGQNTSIKTIFVCDNTSCINYGNP